MKISSNPNDLVNHRNLIRRNSEDVLDRNDIKLLESYMNNEILFKKLFYHARKVIDNKFAVIREEYVDVQIPKVKRGNGKDILGKKLQEDAVIIGEIIAKINDVLDTSKENIEVDVIKESLDDRVMTAGSLETEGNIQRIAVANPVAAKLLRMNMRFLIFSEIIKREIKEVEERFP
ncbi:MAG: hypothetical protein LBQ13_00450 [Endomicrobium sp.]|nr:hypothetical protein [Endomicrobium sp.]